MFWTKFSSSFRTFYRLFLKFLKNLLRSLKQAEVVTSGNISSENIPASSRLSIDKCPRRIILVICYFYRKYFKLKYYHQITGSELSKPVGHPTRKLAQNSSWGHSVFLIQYFKLKYLLPFRPDVLYPDASARRIFWVKIFARPS